MMARCMVVVALVVAVTVVTLGVTHAQLTEVVSGDDKAHAKELAIATLDDKSTSLCAASCAASALQAIGETYSKGCKRFAKALKGASSVRAAYKALKGLRALDCKVKASTGVIETIQQGLGAEDLDKLYHAVVGASFLPAASQAKLSVDYEEVVATVVALGEEDGTFRGAAGDAEGTARNAGKAYKVLAAALGGLGEEAGGEAVEMARSAMESMGQLFDAATGSEDAVLQLGSSKQLSTTMLAVSGAFDLAAAVDEEPDLSPSQVTAFAAFFMAARASTDIHALANSLRGLAALAASPVGSPISVRVLSPALDAGATGTAGDLVVQVTDLFGVPVEEATVEVTAHPINDFRDLVLNKVEMSYQSDGRYSVPFAAQASDLCVYDLILTVIPKEELYLEAEVPGLVKLTTEAVFGDVTVAVTKGAKLGKGSKGRHTASFPNAVTEALTASSTQYLHVMLSITSKSTGGKLSPHQVFLRLTHKESGSETFFAAASRKSKSKSKSKSAEHRITVDVGDRESLHKATQDGVYDMHLLIGDATLKNPAVWRIGSIDLYPPSAPTPAPKPLYHEPLMHASDVATEALPTIEHQFRAPESRPSTLVSRSFTAAALAPLAFLFVAWASKGANLGRLPAGGAASVFAVVFHATIAAILVLYIVYWFSLTMFQTLAYLAPLALLAVLSGHRLLRAVSRSEAA